MEENFIEPKYPAGLYTKRPNSSALLSPLNDFTFKAIFTQETKDSNFALKCFISAALGREILHVTLKSNEPPAETKKQKKMTFDVSVQFDDGELADIELQTRSQDYDFGMRAEIQAARLLTNNAKKGKTWKSKKVYQISVLNFQYKNNDNKELRWYTMTDDSGEKLDEKLNVVFIDLVAIRDHYRKFGFKNLTSIEKWGLFFSYVDHEEKKDLVNRIVKTEKGIMAAKEIVKYMSKADSNWLTQNSIWVAERDYNTRKQIAMDKARKEGLELGLAEGREKGIAKGLEKGIAKGLQQKTIEAAKNLYNNDISIELIANSLNITVEEVKKIVKKK